MPQSDDTKATGAFADRLRKVAEGRAPASNETGATRPHEKRLPRESVFANATLVMRAVS